MEHRPNIDGIYMGDSNSILIVIVTTIMMTMRWKEEAAILLHRQPWASLIADACYSTLRRPQLASANQQIVPHCSWRELHFVFSASATSCLCAHVCVCVSICVRVKTVSFTFIRAVAGCYVGR